MLGPVSNAVPNLPSATDASKSLTPGKWRRLAKALGVGLTVTVIVGPIVIWLITGSVGWFPAIYGAEALLGVVFRSVARSMGLPAWSASESYITRLRRWRGARR